jgi:hypothetical protein
LPKAWCEIAEAPVVKHSAACTVALAVAGGTPSDSSSVVAVTPYAMPSEPSTICAANPTDHVEPGNPGA